MPRQWRARCTALGMLLPWLAGCEIGANTVASPTPQVVVHATLNAGADEQIILVESSLTGRVSIDDSLSFDPLDPIRTAGGDPISNADVRLFTGVDTVGVRATETLVQGRHTGRYVVTRGQLDIRPSATYRLRVRTGDGRTVTGTTTVPGAPAGWTAAAALAPYPVAFNRDTDTLRLAWPAVTGGWSYAVRAETPYGAWALFSDSTSFALSGELRNFLSGSLAHVFIPGFRQTLSISVIDRHFYDYNRTSNSGFGGTGLISSIDGGLGVFGSLVVLGRRDVTVTRRDTHPLDARWTGTGADGALVDLDLWVDDEAASASTIGGRQRVPERFVIGILTGETVRLATLSGTSSADTLAFFTGRLAGDSLVGSYDRRFLTTGPTRWRRQSR